MELSGERSFISGASLNISATWNGPASEICRTYWLKSQKGSLGAGWVPRQRTSLRNSELINSQKAYNMHLDLRRCKISTEGFNLPVALDLMKHKEQQNISSCIHSHEWVNTKDVSQKWQCFGKWRIFDWLHTVTFPQMKAKVPLNSRFPEGLWTCNILFSPFKWHE